MRTTQLAAFTLLGLAIFAIAPKHDADVRPGPQQRAPHGASSRPARDRSRRSERAAIRLISVVAAAILLSVSIPAASREATPARHDSAWPGITIGPASDAWTRRVEWGLGRFREAGLQLPPMVITVHDDDASCDGNSGLFLPNDPWEVHLCVGDDADSRPARLTTLHELAHAWAESQLSPADKAAFLKLRGLDVWYDPHVPPHLRGEEHAAEVISWGLMDEMIPIIRIYDAEPATLSEAFNLLVHQPPLWDRVAASTPASATAATKGSVGAGSSERADGDVARPHVLDSQLADVIVRVRGAGLCTGTPIRDTHLVVTAAHCVLDASGSIDPALKVLRKGDEYRVVSVLVDTRYHTSPSPLLDAAVLVTDTVIPGPAATLGASFPTAGLVTLAGFQPLDTDGTLLRGTRSDDLRQAGGDTGGIVHISSAAAGCTQPASAAQITATRVTMPCGLVPGASGGGLFVEVGHEVFLVGVISTVSDDFTANALAPLTSVHGLLDNPLLYTHDVPHEAAVPSRDRVFQS